jgi:hypothetical protein
MIYLPNLVRVLNTAPDVDVFDHATQDAVNGQAPTVRRAENDPIKFIESGPSEPLAIIDKGGRPLFKDEAHLPLDFVLVPRLRRDINATFSLFGTHINRAQNLTIENFKLGDVSNLANKVFFWVDVMNHNHGRHELPL